MEHNSREGRLRGHPGKEFEYKKYEEYLKEQVDILDALPPGQFEPDLAKLDQIVGSLEVQSK